MLEAQCCYHVRPRRNRPAASSRLELGRNMQILLEIGIIALSVVSFVILDWYVLGCEKV